MAYDSDTRIKEYLKSIGDIDKLKLRVFDESHEDHLTWQKNGLTFKVNGIEYGSNDGIWFIEKPWIVKGIKISDKTPVIAVEGSYGTERGNTGSAQYARFSHALGAVMNDIVGVYLLPKFSEYHTAEGNILNAKWRFDMVYGCLGATEIEGTPYLMIDAYDTESPTLKELVKIFSTNDKEKIMDIIKTILDNMKNYADKTFCETYRTKKVDYNISLTSPRRSFAYSNGTIGKILMFNVVSFSNHNFRTNTRYRSGRFRNGHTIVGDTLINRYWFKKDVDLILPRWTHNDCFKLDSLRQKEWTILRMRDDVNIITLDDLIIKDKKLEAELRSFIDTLPLLGEALIKKNMLVNWMKKEFEKNNIEVDRKTADKLKKDAQKNILNGIKKDDKN